MSKISDGNTVRVHYTGTLDNGEIFDSSKGKTPLEFTMGKGQLIPGFEKAVLGLTAGETTTVHIPANEAYGDMRDDLIGKVPVSQLPEGLVPEIGMRLQSRTPEGHPLVVKVIEITEEDITLDANHELAGKDLNFEIEVVEIVS